MNQSELQAMLKSIEVARGTAEGAVAQLQSIELGLKSLLGGGGSYGAPEAVRRHPPATTPGAQDRNSQPDEFLLAQLPCPKCKAPMVWRWSKVNGEWFAGCSEFAGRTGCRGSRSYASIFSGHAKAEPEPVEPMYISEGPTWAADDLERMEKHHGPAAADEFASDKIPF